MDKFYKSIEELLIHAKKLESKSLYDLYGDKSKDEYLGKGGFGNKVEELHYGLANNNEGRPDVLNLGIEIKTNPLNKLVNRGFSPKESVSLSMINFTDIADEEFNNSAFWNKNKMILYNMYHYTGGDDYLNKFLLIDLISPSASDLEIIKKDWQYIQNKAKEYKADELSQSDTDYLIAMTKGSKGQVPQPYANGKGEAKRRAYAFKGAYIRHLLGEYTLVEEGDNIYYKRKKKPTLYSLLTSEDNGNIEKVVIEKFRLFLGKSDIEIASCFNKEENFIKQYENKNLNKARWHNNTSLILTGVQKKFLSRYIEEFAKSGLTVKTVRLNKQGDLCEEVSFRTQDFGGLFENTWEESSLFQEMSCKFLWVVYKEDDVKKNVYNLYKCLFWKMPQTDLDFLYKKWIEFKVHIGNQDYHHQYFQEDDSFYYLKIKDNIGGMNKVYNDHKVTKLSHWLRKAYVRDIIYNKKD